jgi:hypothetical protein
MGYLGWVLFVLSVIWYFKSVTFSHRKRIHLNCFVTYLLLSDEIREAQKKGFQNWIRAADASDPQALIDGAFQATERLADELALAAEKPGASSLFGARGMIWAYKERGAAGPDALDRPPRG